MKNLDELLSAAAAVKIPAITSVHSGNSVMSFGIVNSESNGKRFTITQALVKAVGIDKTVELLPIPDEGVLLIAKKLPFENAIKKTLKEKSGSRLAYSAPVVKLLVESFDLDFGKHVSMTFQDIKIDKLSDGSTVAIINMLNPKPYSNSEPENNDVSDEE